MSKQFKSAFDAVLALSVTERAALISAVSVLSGFHPPETKVPGAMGKPVGDSSYATVAAAPATAPQAKPAAEKKAKAAKAPSSNPSGRKKKGNPKRVSQYATHPLYVEYKRLQATVRKQAKELGTTFNEVDSKEKTSYDEVFSQWLKAKSSFRSSASKTKTSPTHENRESENEDHPMGEASGASGAPSNTGRVAGSPLGSSATTGEFPTYDPPSALRAAGVRKWGDITPSSEKNSPSSKVHITASSVAASMSVAKHRKP